MEISKNEKRLLSPNKIVLPIGTEENGILDEYIQTNDKNCLEIFTCSICSCLAWDIFVVQNVISLIAEVV